MTNQEYSQYLLTPRWRSVANERVRIDNATCQLCGRTRAQGARLQVHHLSYHHIGAESESDRVFTDLVCLCSECHKNVHHMMNRITSSTGRRGWKDSLSWSNHNLSESEVKLQ